MKIIQLLMPLIAILSLSLIGIVFTVAIILYRRWHIEKQFEYDDKKGHKKVPVLRERQESTDDHYVTQTLSAPSPEKSQTVKKPELPKKKLPPRKRGGRPRGKIPQSAIGETIRTQRSPIKPELICWEEGGCWILGIEIADELEEVHVTQNDDVLEENSISEGRYQLKQVTDSVTVTTAKGTSHIFNIPTRDGYLIFKMRKNWNGPGRFIKYPSSGYYVTIVPNSWKRDEQVSGSASISPEPVQLDGYAVHFFYIERGSDQGIGFVASEGERIRVRTKHPSFILTGKEIEDASEDMGSLFAEKPPLLESLGEKEWDNVGLIVIGEEGKGRNKWRMSFVPQSGYKSQKMPNELTSRRGGWYFVRIYDGEDNLLESIDFRFMKGLKAIKLHPYSHLPRATGHKPTTVSFHHEQDLEVELIKTPIDLVQIKREDKRTDVVIPSTAPWDLTYWELKSSDVKVTVELIIERIRWSLITENTEKKTNWQDTPFIVEREYFQATSDQIICIWFPRPRWEDKIRVGFDASTNRIFSVKVDERSIKIPLCSFCDSEEVNDATQEVELKLWLTSYQCPKNGTTICRIVPDVVVNIEDEQEPELPEPAADPFQMPNCSTCDHARSKKNTCWCRRYHWPRINDSIFQKDYAHNTCGDWRGEYFDAEGMRHTDRA